MLLRLRIYPPWDRADTPYALVAHVRSVRGGRWLVSLPRPFIRLV